MSEHHYALSELSQAKQGILQACEDLPVSRAKIDETMKSKKKNAKDWHSFLTAEYEKLLEAIESCRYCLLEMELEDLADKAHKLYQSVKKFNLATPDYSKLVAVLKKYLCELPDEQDTKVNARIIGHLMNNVRMGYYPTDLEHIRMIHDAVDFPDTPVNLLDPCCGCGLALHRLGMGETCSTFGIEIDDARAEEAQTRLNRVGFGSYFLSRVGKECFHLALLNPPYLSVMSENGSKVRHEKRFLIETIDRLVIGGLLIYIVPYYRLTPDILRILADNFSDISIYRFCGKEFSKFKQVAVFGVRQLRVDGTVIAEELLQKSSTLDNIDELTRLQKGRYVLPSIEKEVTVFKGATFNVAELEEQLKKSNSFDKLVKKNILDSKERNPLLPLKAGQVGLIGGSGLINGLIECDTPHVIKGRIVKVVSTDEVPVKLDKNNTPILTEVTETKSNKLIFNILTPSGFKSLS